MTVLPARFTRFAPAGAFTSAARPTCEILPAFTTMVALSMTRPSPTMTRAPSKTVVAFCASIATDHADKAIRAHARRFISLLLEHWALGIRHQVSRRYQAGLFAPL